MFDFLKQIWYDKEGVIYLKLYSYRLLQPPRLTYKTTGEL